MTIVNGNVPDLTNRRHVAISTPTPLLIGTLLIGTRRTLPARGVTSPLQTHEAAHESAPLTRERASYDRRESLAYRTAMKEGLLGGKLRLSPRTNLEEARLHVARWTSSGRQRHPR
jgi:hypothetical protein